jgi:hypothetical protein
MSDDAITQESIIPEIYNKYIEKIEFHPGDITTIILNIEPIIQDIIKQFDNKLTELEKEKLILHFSIKRHRTIHFRMNQNNAFGENRGEDCKNGS